MLPYIFSLEYHHENNLSILSKIIHTIVYCAPAQLDIDIFLSQGNIISGSGF